MHRLNTAGFATLTLIAFLTLAGCAPKAQLVKDDSIIADVTGLEIDESEAPTIIYKRPGAPGLGEFDRFIIDPVQVFYSDPKMQELSLEQVDRMQSYLDNAMYEELTDAGYEVGTRSEAGTLRISFTLSGLSAPSAAPNVIAAVVPLAVSVGEVTVEAVIRDGLSNQVEAVVVARASGSRWLNPTPWSAWADVENFFDSWAKGFREAVDEAHGR
jgi:hypothetical protein